MQLKGLTILTGLLLVQEICAWQLDGGAVEQQVLDSINCWKGSSTKPPNIIFILTDDQDLRLDSLEYTPLTRKHIQEKGTFYENHFVTTALCCPSRVSLWTGRQAHNTNVTDVNPPYGGYPKFVERGFNENYLPVWLQQAGYDTYYTGKLFNAHTVDNYDSPYINGFNGSDFLLDPYTYQYLNATFQRNHASPVSYEGQHSVDIVREKALGFLQDGLDGDRPFFLGVAPIAPHSNVNISTDFNHGVPDETIKFTPPIPLERHKHLFKDVKIPRTENFNPDKPSGANWVKDLPKRKDSDIEYFDHFYRSRLRALQGVDELVDAIVTRLDEHGQLENTYIVYTADNGYHIGQHRLPPGKTCGFEEDIRVPLFIRGPGVPEGHVEDTVTTHIDLAPTLFEIAGIPLRKDFDGTPVPITLNSNPTSHEHVIVEYWGYGYLEATDDINGQPFSVPNNTYKSIRVIGEDYNLYYSVWCSNEHELYDLSSDPYELNNLYPAGKKDVEDRELLGRSLTQVIDRLDSLLLVLKSCQGPSCIKPWSVLHPDNSVQNLRDALDKDYDSFYHHQYKVSFNHCELGYIIDAEGPQVPLTHRYGVSWDTWA